MSIITGLLCSSFMKCEIVIQAFLHLAPNISVIHMVSGGLCGPMPTSRVASIIAGKAQEFAREDRKIHAWPHFLYMIGGALWLNNLPVR